MIKSNKTGQFKYSSILLIISSLVVILSYVLIFGEFFPNRQQRIGTDYSYFLPLLLNGYYWFQVNGLSEVPWFTPAFCAGIPYFPNPQVMFYSVPQFLTFIIDPFTSVYVTFILFAFLGFIGFYFLLRTVFSTTPEVAIFGATVFLFNGFYAHRMMIGHLTYHSFMLIPLIAYFLLRSPTGKQHDQKINKFLYIILAGISIAYMMHSGMANFILPSLLSIIGIWLISVLWNKNFPGFWLRLSCAGLVAILLAASKLVAGISYLHYFPRDYYTLPGIEGVFGTILFVLKALFSRVIASTDKLDIVNYVIEIEFFQHEVEYSITFIPLLVMIFYLVYLIWKLIKTRSWPGIGLYKSLILVLLTGMFLLPVVLNIYTPGWNEFLKNLPYIKSSSALMRWIAIDIPLVILISALAVNVIKIQNIRYVITISGIISVILINFIQDRDWYHDQIYKPDEITNAYNTSKQSGRPPEIKYIGAYLKEDNKFDPDVANRNDVLVYGISQLACNEPIFGYKLERFPFGGINTGEVFDEYDGYFNIKDPVCYVFGKKNGCVPGEHFKTDRSEAVKNFVNYKPINFRMPLLQVIANWVNILALVYVIIFLLLFILSKYTNINRVETG